MSSLGTSWSASPQNRVVGLRKARVLVAGAGALGNEVIKNFALLGVGHLAIADMDTIEISNLTRSPLFREADAGKPKAECAARDLYPAIDARPLVGNITADLGLGWVRWADVVVGALDNREARIFINSACARLGKPWIDGGIEVLQGIARGFHPPHTACYQCTMSEVTGRSSTSAARARCWPGARWPMAARPPHRPRRP
jgi:adenylyltransferase/sulfurtransferase